MNKKILIPILSAVGVCIAGAVAAVLILKPFQSPKADLMLALSRTYGSGSIFAIMSGNEDMAGGGYFQKPYIEDVKNTAKVALNLSDKNVENETKVTLEDVGGDLLDSDLANYRKAGISYTNRLDRKRDISNSTISITYSGLNLLKGYVYKTPDRFSLKVPDLLDGYLTVQPETFKEDYNDSSLTMILGSIDDASGPDYSSYGYQDYEPVDLQQNLSLKAYIFTPEGRNDLKNLYLAMEVEKTGNTEIIPVGGKDEKCREYVLSIPEAELRKFLTGYLDWLYGDLENVLNENPYLSKLVGGGYGFYSNPDYDTPEKILAELKKSTDEFITSGNVKDYTVSVYLTSKKQIAKYGLEDSLMIDKQLTQVELEYVMTGQKNPLDHTELSIRLANPESETDISFFSDTQENSGVLDEKYQLIVAKDQDKKTEYNIKLNYDISEHCLIGEYYYTEGINNFILEYKGYTQADVKNNTVDIDVRKCNITSRGKTANNIYSLSGRYRLKELEEEIKEFDGPEYDLFHLDMFTMFDLYSEIESNWNNSQLGQIIGGF